MGFLHKALKAKDKSFEMDRDWMSANRLTVKYREGVDFFLEFSAKNADNPDLVHCPCLKCGNMERMKIAQIREHLFKNGIDRSYKSSSTLERNST
ncbi:hypothetical protein G4B88_012557 [Cannabis sativa]|uniref:Transposase-associated domain-containing protein n=1 Tax=Cannabis sativa TaxID=3483 RepID=A0A7J6E2L6_CANSA|nr:hypothetical protein G4B88_012557 [Cannabis sativa]